MLVVQQYRGEYILGIDYRTNSCNAAVINANYGAEIASFGIHRGAVGGCVRKGVLVNMISAFICDTRVGSAIKGEERLISGGFIKATAYPRPAFHNKYASLYCR